MLEAAHSSSGQIVKYSEHLRACYLTIESLKLVPVGVFTPQILANATHQYGLGGLRQFMGTGFRASP